MMSGSLQILLILREWSAEKRKWITEYMLRQSIGAALCLAHIVMKDGSAFCCIDGVISGETAKYANLTMLFADDYWKRRGIGKLLFQKVCRYAFTIGAEELFISAIPSAETIAFYQSMGCTDANEILQLLLTQMMTAVWKSRLPDCFDYLIQESRIYI